MLASEAFVTESFTGCIYTYQIVYNFVKRINPMTSNYTSLTPIRIILVFVCVDVRVSVGLSVCQRKRKRKEIREEIYNECSISRTRALKHKKLYSFSYVWIC